MRLTLTPDFRRKARNFLISAAFDIADGQLDFPEQFATGLEELAREIRAQNPAVNEAAKNQVL